MLIGAIVGGLWKATFIYEGDVKKLMASLTAEERERALGMLQSGISSGVFAQRFGCHHSTMTKLHRRYSQTETTRDCTRTGQRRVTTPRQDRDIGRKEGNVLFNDALSTFYLRLYGVRHMVKDHSDSEKGNPLPPHRPLLPINSKGSFICTIPQT